MDSSMDSNREFINEVKRWCNPIVNRPVSSATFIYLVHSNL